MAVAKRIVSPFTFLTYSLGCRVNQAELSAISNQLSAISMEIFDERKHSSPNIILINTCAVTSKAERESRKAVRHFKRLYPKAKIIAIGCASKFIKDADLVIENQDKASAGKIILQKFPGLKTPRRWPNGLLRGERLQENLFTQSGRALVKIQEGCNQFCTYCIVPYLRGKPKSSPAKEIICQINRLVQKGIKEIILCGINLSLYGKDLTPQTTLSILIKKILKETKAERISLSSIYPKMLLQDTGTDPGQGPSLKGYNEFTKLVLNNPRISQYFHLSLQSGSQETIKNMARKTDLEKLLKTLRFIKEKCSEFTFRADIIVGFPTETEKNFQETLDFIESTRISFVHSFLFSVRPDTKAEGFIKSGKWRDLSPAIKKERVKRLKEVVKKIQKKEAERLIGKTLPCLIIRKVAKNYETIANNSWPVKIKAPLRPSTSPRTVWCRAPLRASKGQGKILPVKIINYKDNYLRGRILSFPT